MSANIVPNGIYKNKHNSNSKPRLVVKWLTDEELFNCLAKCQCCSRHTHNKPKTLTDQKGTKIYQPKDKQICKCNCKCNCRLIMRSLVRQNVKFPLHKTKN